MFDYTILFSRDFYVCLAGFFVLITWLLYVIHNKKEALSREKTYDMVEKQKSTEPDVQSVKTLFSLTAKEILIGEKIIDGTGKSYKKVSSIKDAPTRLAAQNNAVLSFAIDTKTGYAYKVLKFRNIDKKNYYIIDFSELNRYLEMSDSANAKYKRINADNWKQICHA